MKSKVTIFLLSLFFSLSAFSQTNMNLQLNPIIDTIAKNLKRIVPGKKLGIAYISDSNKNVTELSERLANYLAVRLVIDGLPLVDRSLYDYNTDEKRRAAKGELSIDSTVARAKNAGIEVYVKGEYAYSSNAQIILTLKAISVKDNTIVSAVLGELPLNDQTIDQSKGQLSSLPGRQSISATSPTRIGDNRTNPLDDLFRAKISDMRVEDCNCVPIYKEYCGGICFENQTGEDLVMYDGYFLEATNGGREWYKRLLPVPNGGRNCIDKIDINSNYAEQVTIGIVFKFRTLDSDHTKYGEIKLTVDKGKVKAYVLTKANLPLIKR